MEKRLEGDIIEFWLIEGRVADYTMMERRSDGWRSGGKARRGEDGDRSSSDLVKNHGEGDIEEEGMEGRCV